MCQTSDVITLNHNLMAALFWCTIQWDHVVKITFVELNLFGL